MAPLTGHELFSVIRQLFLIVIPENALKNVTTITSDTPSKTTTAYTTTPSRNNIAKIMHTIGNIQIQKLARSKHNFRARYLAPQAMACGIGLVVTFRFDNL